MHKRLEIDVWVCPKCGLVDLEHFECEGEEDSHEPAEAVRRRVVEASPLEAVDCCGGPVGSNVTADGLCGACGRDLAAAGEENER